MSSLFALFLVTSLANILTPGLGVVMIITLAAEYGWRRTMSGALGTALGIAFLFIAGMSGVGVIVASSPMLFAAIKLLGECQDFCVWGGYSRGSPTRLPFVFEMQYARPDAIAGAKVEGPARSAGGSSLAPAIARREAAGALAREV